MSPKSAMCDSMNELETSAKKSSRIVGGGRLGVPYYAGPITMVKYMHVKYVDVMFSHYNFR